MYRWHLASNFLALRIVSYCMDLHWAYLSPSVVQKVPDSEKAVPDSYELLVATARPLPEYGYIQFMSYCMYCPLYMAGPILPYNAYIGQHVGRTQGCLISLLAFRYTRSY